MAKGMLGFLFHGAVNPATTTVYVVALERPDA